jgi:hypothetical protein
MIQKVKEWDGIPTSDAEDRELLHSDQEVLNNVEIKGEHDSTTEPNKLDSADSNDTTHAEAETPDSTIHTPGPTSEIGHIARKQPI